ncbi:MAG: lysophospholipid acyltransferase family protein, partial [Clostridia bacterium]|nr:lysophospholipid acyltransferase family protein [Clostridia bacterium]
LERIFYRPLFPYKKYWHTELFDDRPYIFVGNHLILLDVVVIAMATSKPVHFMAKRQLFEKGLMKKFVTKCQCIPVNRDGTDVKAIMLAMKYLKGGESIIIFPEGTRNKSEEVFLPFKSGSAAISIKTKTPIVPVVQIKKIKFLRRSRIIYGEPIEFREYYDKRLTEEDIKKCDDALRERMLGLHTSLSEITAKKSKKKNI